MAKRQQFTKNLSWRRSVSGNHRDIPRWGSPVSEACGATLCTSGRMKWRRMAKPRVPAKAAAPTVPMNSRDYGGRIPDPAKSATF